MSESLFIRHLIHRIMNGEVRIPSFQLGFVWDADRFRRLCLCVGDFDRVFSDEGSF